MRSETFGDGRRALRFGRQRLNLHEAGAEIEPYALRPLPGSADLCFLVEDSLDHVAGELAEAGIAIELGPVERAGAAGVRTIRPSASTASSAWTCAATLPTRAPR